MNKNQYYAYFQEVDAVLAPFILELPSNRLPGSLYYSTYELFQRLSEDVIGQQLSGKVAKVMRERFSALFSSLPIQPKDLLELEPEVLRGVGISWAKVRTIRDLAEKSMIGDISWEEIPQMTDKEVFQTLLPVWGIGEWTVEMFLLFTLGRIDVFSPKDLGLKKAMQKLYCLPRLPTPQEASLRAEAWAPYRSIASLALWWSLDNPGQRESIQVKA